MRDTSVKKKKNETIPESFAWGVKWLIGFMVLIYSVLILGILPFYFEKGYTHIGTDKATFFQSAIHFLFRYTIPLVIIYLILSLWITLDKRRREKNYKINCKLNWTDGFAFIYGVCVVISYLCTDYRETALWGTKGWYMGMMPHLALVATYFLVSRFLIAGKSVLYLCLPVSVVIFVLGCLNRFDIWPLAMENSGVPSYISTIGNINWYCGYVVCVLFIGVGLLWLERDSSNWYKALLSGYCCTGFAALILQGSDSGIFALFAVFFVMFILSAKPGKSKVMCQFFWMLVLLSTTCVIVFWIRILFGGRMNLTTEMMDLLTYSPLPFFMLAISLIGWITTNQKKMDNVWCLFSRLLVIAVSALLVVFVTMIVLNTAKPGSIGVLSDAGLFTFNDQWASNRGATWRLGLAVFEEQDMLHKLVGVGPDCMADYLYQGSSAALQADAQKAFAGLRLTNAHNEILTILINEGICGVVTFAGLLICLLFRLLKSYEANTYATACGLCLLAYISNNMWSFQQSLNVSTMFVIVGLGIGLIRE